MTLGAFAIALVLAAAIAYLYGRLRAREVANHFVAKYCAREGVQLLEGTVVYQHARLRSDADGLRLERLYHFEYCPDNVTRRRGFILLTGNGVRAFGLEPRSRH